VTGRMARRGALRSINDPRRRAPTAREISRIVHTLGGSGDVAAGIRYLAYIYPVWARKRYAVWGMRQVSVAC
jgi:hypothetical protein